MLEGWKDITGASITWTLSGNMTKVGNCLHFLICLVTLQLKIHRFSENLQLINTWIARYKYISIPIILSTFKIFIYFLFYLTYFWIQYTIEFWTRYINIQYTCSVGKATCKNKRWFLFNLLQCLILFLLYLFFLWWGCIDCLPHT